MDENFTNLRAQAAREAEELEAAQKARDEADAAEAAAFDAYWAAQSTGQGIAKASAALEQATQAALDAKAAEKAAATALKQTLSASIDALRAQFADLTRQAEEARDTRRVVLIGRHDADVPGYRVLERKNVLWPHDVGECLTLLGTEVEAAKRQGARVLLQNVPAILGVALSRGYWAGMVGVIIPAEPKSRPENVTTERVFSTPQDAENAIGLVWHANGRAQVQQDGLRVQVGVAPVPAFVFDRVEWL